VLAQIGDPCGVSASGHRGIALGEGNLFVHHVFASFGRTAKWAESALTANKTTGQSYKLSL
jgi:hypothetical protein